ncbi:MAG: rhodanese-like domain-containing protein [Pseudomonadota bacterium]
MSDDWPIEMSVSEYDALRREGRSHCLLDVREPAEVAASRIEGSLHIPMRSLPERLAELPDDQPIVVMCHLGGRSLQVVQWLRTQGRDQTTSLAGGIAAWAQEIDPSVGAA